MNPRTKHEWLTKFCAKKKKKRIESDVNNTGAREKQEKKESSRFAFS